MEESCPHTPKLKQARRCSKWDLALRKRPTVPRLAAATARTLERFLALASAVHRGTLAYKPAEATGVLSTSPRTHRGCIARYLPPRTR